MLLDYLFTIPVTLIKCAIFTKHPQQASVSCALIHFIHISIFKNIMWKMC